MPVSRKYSRALRDPASKECRKIKDAAVDAVLQGRCELICSRRPMAIRHAPCYAEEDTEIAASVARDDNDSREELHEFRGNNRIV